MVQLRHAGLLAVTLIFMFLNPETRVSILVNLLAVMTLIYFRYQPREKAAVKK